MLSRPSRLRSTGVGIFQNQRAGMSEALLSDTKISCCLMMLDPWGVPSSSFGSSATCRTAGSLKYRWEKHMHTGAWMCLGTYHFTVVQQNNDLLSSPNGQHFVQEAGQRGKFAAIKQPTFFTSRRV